jgi:hypothetical protein
MTEPATVLDGLANAWSWARWWLRYSLAVWRGATNPERVGVIAAWCAVAAFTVFVSADGAGITWVTLAALTVWALVDTTALYSTVKLRAFYARTMEQQPSGAPRVATVRCSEGRTHRFLYGPNGWEEAGPADTPEMEEL